MNKSLKRICNVDIKRFNSDKELLNKSGIFAHFDDDDITKCHAMIIGPEGTPYAHGILFFSIIFPHNYPFSPPKVAYISNSVTRIHPNLYVSGKVCLSILGTWHGPGWTSAMNIVSILTTIQSLLTKNPIEHEPGFENDTSYRSKIYKHIINFERYKSLIIERSLTLHLRPEQLAFKNDIIKYMAYNKDKILEEFYKDKIDMRKGTLTSHIYSIHLVTDGKTIEKRLLRMFDKIDKICKEDSSILNNVIEEVVEAGLSTQATDLPVQEPEPELSPDPEPTPKKTYQRKCPNDPAKKYPVATIKVSENDNKQYIVKEYIYPTKTILKWVKYTQ